MKKIICTAIGLFMFTGLMPLLICGKRPTISIPVNTASVSLPPAVNTPQQSKSSEAPSFKILDTSTSQIISIPDREFMYGALPYEVPPTFEPEALKAQAIAIYTYFSRARKKNVAIPLKILTLQILKLIFQLENFIFLTTNLKTSLAVHLMNILLK